MISKKRAPHVSDKELARVIRQVYDDLNELIDGVNASASEASDSASGKAGNIRVVFDRADKKYYLEGKTANGWARVEATLSTPQ
jgi:nitrogen-specific signal transduction histidine kinase